MGVQTAVVGPSEDFIDEWRHNALSSRLLSLHLPRALSFLHPLPGPREWRSLATSKWLISRQSPGLLLVLWQEHIARGAHLVQGREACRLDACNRTCRSQAHVCVSLHDHRQKRERGQDTLSEAHTVCRRWHRRGRASCRRCWPARLGRQA